MVGDGLENKQKYILFEREKCGFKQKFSPFPVLFFLGYPSLPPLNPKPNWASEVNSSPSSPKTLQNFAGKTLKPTHTSITVRWGQYCGGNGTDSIIQLHPPPGQPSYSPLSHLLLIRSNRFEISSSTQIPQIIEPPRQRFHPTRGLPSVKIVSFWTWLCATILAPQHRRRHRRLLWAILLRGGSPILLWPNAYRLYLRQ